MLCAVLFYCVSFLARERKILSTWLLDELMWGRTRWEQTCRRAKPACTFLRYYVCEKTHFSEGILWRPFAEWKTKGTFCFANQCCLNRFKFNYAYNTIIPYCCFVRESGWGAEQAGFEFVLSWHWLDRRPIIFFVLFLYFFQKPSYLFKDNCI